MQTSTVQVGWKLEVENGQNFRTQACLLAQSKCACSSICIHSGHCAEKLVQICGPGSSWRPLHNWDLQTEYFVAFFTQVTFIGSGLCRVQQVHKQNCACPVLEVYCWTLYFSPRTHLVLKLLCWMQFCLQLCPPQNGVALADGPKFNVQQTSPSNSDLLQK